MNEISYSDWMVIFGLVLAALLGVPMAILVAVLMRDRGTKKCPHCAETIRSDARVCRYCGRSVE